MDVYAYVHCPTRKRFTTVKEEQFLDVLYGTTPDPGFLTALLPHFASVMGTHSANVATVRLTDGAIIDQTIIGVDESLLARGAEHYLPRNPLVMAAAEDWQRNPAHCAVARFTHGAELVPTEVYRETEYYRDFNRFTGVGDDMISIHTPVNGHQVGFGASIGGRCFDDADRARAARLLPHIARGIGMHFALTRRSFDKGGLTIEVGDRPGFHVRGGRLVDANLQGYRLLEHGTLLRMRGGILRFRDEVANRALEQISGLGGPPTLALIVTDEAGRWLVQMVRRVEHASLADPHVDRTSVAIFALALDGQAWRHQPDLAAFSDVTPTERAVLALMLEGHNVPEIAVRLNRTRETVRAHIKSLRQKFGASSATDLVRIAGSLLPLRKA